LAEAEKPNIVISAVGFAQQHGFGLMSIIKPDEQNCTPLVLYTNRDLSIEDIEKLTLDLIRHLVKFKTPERKFLATIRELINGLLKSKHH
jgi:hypothetical protein